MNHHSKGTILRGFAGLLCWFVIGCSENGTSAGESSAPASIAQISVVKDLPTEFKEGEEKFNAFCSPCHGSQASGTGQGPPLVHKIYEPSHHADFAFQRAAAQGVKAHHWKFGNMPKIEGVTADDVTQIIGYIRWLQRQAGIS
ncbi:MAG TPA: cytochrome c [Nitrospirales bacterium]|nr:cytochrome c [Nitrospira sp. MA-1]HNP60605.1 cytochrome c [Nitrospirales bacterium]